MSVHHKIALAVAVSLSLAGCRESRPTTNIVEADVSTSMRVADKVARLLDNYPERWTRVPPTTLQYTDVATTAPDNVTISLGLVSEDELLAADAAKLPRLARYVTVMLANTSVPGIELVTQKSATPEQVMVLEAAQRWYRTTHDQAAFRERMLQQKVTEEFLSRGAK